MPSIFTDFDGTLAEIVEDRDKAKMILGTRGLLLDLAKYTEVAVISGRNLHDLERKIEIKHKNVSYVGTHGLQIRLKNNLHIHEEKPLTIERAEVGQLSAQLFGCLDGRYRLPGRDYGGVSVEHKDTCVAVHYREADLNYLSTIIASVDSMMTPYTSLRKLDGKMVIDIRPKVSWDKGNAVNWLLNNNGQRFRGDRFPIYIGDDITDQDAFKAVKHNGVGIYVGPPDDGGDAEFFLNDPREVKELLSMLLDFFFPKSLARASLLGQCT